MVVGLIIGGVYTCGSHPSLWRVLRAARSRAPLPLLPSPPPPHHHSAISRICQNDEAYLDNPDIIKANTVLEVRLLAVTRLWLILHHSMDCILTPIVCHPLYINK